MQEPAPRPVGAFLAEEGMLAIHSQPLYYRRLRPLRGAPRHGPTLVFLHEALGCTAMWHAFPAQVAADTGLTAVSFDRSGYGRSPRAARPQGRDYLHREAETVLPRVLESLDIRRAILVGHSDGGSIALLAAAALPRVVVGIVTEAAHVFVEPLTRAGIRETLAAYAPQDLEQRLARYHGEKTRSLFFAWADRWLSEAFRGWNIEACLKRIRCPALVIQGRDDPYGSEGQVTAIVSGIGPAAEPLLLPECGHIPHRRAPAKVREAIAAFAAPLAR